MNDLIQEYLERADYNVSCIERLIARKDYTEARKFAMSYALYDGFSRPYGFTPSDWKRYDEIEERFNSAKQEIYKATNIEV